MKDYADKSFLREGYEAPAPTQQQLLEAAKKRLGKSYVMHPEYSRECNPSHTYPGSDYLRGLRANAIRAGRI